MPAQITIPASGRDNGWMLQHQLAMNTHGRSSQRTKGLVSVRAERARHLQSLTMAKGALMKA